MTSLPVDIAIFFLFLPVNVKSHQVSRWCVPANRFTSSTCLKIRCHRRKTLFKFMSWMNRREYHMRIYMRIAVHVILKRSELTNHNLFWDEDKKKETKYKITDIWRFIVRMISICKVLARSPANNKFECSRTSVATLIADMQMHVNMMNIITSLLQSQQYSRIDVDWNQNKRLKRDIHVSICLTQCMEYCTVLVNIKLN